MSIEFNFNLYLYYWVYFKQYGKKVIEKADYYFLYDTAILAYVIPKRTLQSDQNEEFAQLLKKTLPKVYQ